MALSLKESRSVCEMAEVLYSFLPGSGSAAWKGHVTFASVAHENGVGNFWSNGSKQQAIARLLELTLDRRRENFEALMLGIVKEGMRYRQKNGSPVTEKEIVTLNGLIREVGFKFPSLWDEGFLKSLNADGATRASEIIREEAAAAKLRASAQSQKSRMLDSLKSDFFALSKAMDRQKAGLQFEQVLNGTFGLFALEPRLAYRVTGEQIDGSIKLDSEIYLLEAKWEASRMSEADLLVFRGKVEGKSSATRGIFIAANGFTDVAMRAIPQGKQANFFLMDGFDLSQVLHGHIPLDVMLREKQRRLAEEGKVLHRLTVNDYI